MKDISVLILVVQFSICSFSQEQRLIEENQTEINKEIARNFYRDLWFTNNTDNYTKYVADEYIVHDIGDRKGVKEQAIEQKKIADFFWENGDFDSKIDYQIAEGDFVATRWTGSFKATTLFGRIALETKEPISIINVFRIKNGRIVEFWNHRHDIETPRTLKFMIKGLFIGLLIALLPTAVSLKLRRKLRNISKRY
ncbi:nuclear transport factor 2 family protein [Maribacter halichondriae]|uniref:nuclear transport factor 2 family protein n=1 Tax=Maribacter halichondriae TaxID=2980554 RepID=UPI0023594F69|nr:ester cyclase [Maribacter sp. Hal144]